MKNHLWQDIHDNFNDLTLCGRTVKSIQMFDEPDTDRFGNIRNDEKWCKQCLSKYEQN